MLLAVPLLTSRSVSATRGALPTSGADHPSVTEQAMSEQPVSVSPPVSAGELLRAFLFFLLSRSLSRFSSQIAAVAIGWQIYDLTGSAFDLGMVGLVQFAPTALLVFVAGHAADRFERKRVVQLCQLVEAATALYLAAITYLGAVSEVQIFIATFVLGIAGAFESPTTAALLPLIAPQGSLQRATAVASGAGQVATITGPALGGFAYAIAPHLAYALMLVFWIVGMILTGFIQPRPQAVAKEGTDEDNIFAGVRFIRQSPAILGTISLDLFAVLFGGVTALLPIYARDILETGPLGLGLLRSAPAIGALTTTIILSHYPIERHIGIKMFAVVALFGASTMVFALSTWLPLSMVALAILGAADSISVVIRFSLVQIETPDAMRGRVGAINYLFVGTSNTLGEFESGLLAAWLGAVPSVLIGGIGSLLVAAIWMMIFPSLRRIDKFEPADDKLRS